MLFSDFHIQPWVCRVCTHCGSVAVADELHMTFDLSVWITSVPACGSTVPTALLLTASYPNV